MTNHSLKCPHCGSTDVSRSHRRFYERFLLGMLAYRCRACLRRFHARAPRDGAAAEPSH